MEVKEMLCMNKGDGENSYVKSSIYAQKVASLTQPIVSRAVQSILSDRNNSRSYQVLNVADLGYSSGPNSFTVMTTVIDSIVKTCNELGCEIPEIQFYLNDLVGNDFNTLFKGLTVIEDKFKNVVSCFAMGAPGSFHGRLFPNNSIHLVHSCYGVHWLSQVPKLTSEGGLALNKGKIYLSKTSPPEVSNAYLSQFEEDFLSFLKCRSPELVPGGRMVLIFHGRESEDPADKDNCYTWEVLADAISYMVSQGLIDEEKLDSFNMPYYVPSKKEVEDLIEKEGSFTTEMIDILSINIANITGSSPEFRAKNIRSFTEPMISCHFGEDQVMNKLYDKVTDIIVNDSKQGRESTNGGKLKIFQMEVKETLFMNKGDGENSYVKCAGFPRKVAPVIQPRVSMAVKSLITEKCSSTTFEVLNMADLGCSSGPNAFTVMSTVIESTVKNCRELGFQIPEIQFYLNDLVGNDFNTLFKGLTVIEDKFKNVVSCFAMGAPGSFHGRLFPKNSIHLFHSSCALHWLSKVPKLTNEEGLPLINKEKIYISKTSPPGVINAYFSQFQEDFLLFLKSRSLELVPDGHMILIFHGRIFADSTDRESSYVWETLAEAISYLVSQGLIDEEKLDSFNVPYYIASQEEVADLVEKEGSFSTEVIETFEVELEGTWATPESIARSYRAITESMISHQFGEEVMDKLYDKVKDILVEDLKKLKLSAKAASIALELKKRK